MQLLKVFFTFRRTLGRALALAQDPRVALRLKVITGALALFILSPLNILGDIPLVGIVDDVALFGLLLNWFVRAAGHAQGTVDIPG
ncbi:MAG: hypothetical protein ABR591_03455 [Candidatus Velthaea sp.]